MKIFVKPSGVELGVNPESEEYAISLGWIPKDQKVEEQPEPAPARRGRPPKQRVQDGNSSASGESVAPEDSGTSL